MISETEMAELSFNSAQQYQSIDMTGLKLTFISFNLRNYFVLFNYKNLLNQNAIYHKIKSLLFMTLKQL